MPLVKNGAVVTDSFVRLADDDVLPIGTDVIVSLARWLRERESLSRSNARVGVSLANADRVEDLAADIGRIDLVVLNFPKFSDGRAYSQARRLRERLGYGNELRATGHILQDQILFMRRCGFDAFEIARDDAVDAYQRGSAAFSVFFQPTGDERPFAALLRGAKPKTSALTAAE